jgi:hypothetical protein
MDLEDGTHIQYCADCKTSMGDPEDHSWDQSADADVHTCTVEGCGASGAHIWKEDKENPHDEPPTCTEAGYVNQYCAEKKIAKLPDICLPALGEIIQFPEEQKRCAETDILGTNGEFFLSLGYRNAYPVTLILDENGVIIYSSPKAFHSTAEILEELPESIVGNVGPIEKEKADMVPAIIAFAVMVVLGAGSLVAFRVYVRKKN